MSFDVKAYSAGVNGEPNQRAKNGPSQGSNADVIREIREAAVIATSQIAMLHSIDRDKTAAQ